VRYKQTFFGYAWAVLVPIVQVLVFSVFFGSILGVGARVDAAAGQAIPYPLFALGGLIVWNLFKATIEGASISLIANGNIIRKIYVPRLLLPFSAVGKPLVDTFVVVLMLFGLLAWYAADARYDLAVTAQTLLAPVFLLGVVVPGMGLGLMVAAVTVPYRDLQYVVPVAVGILFYVTPVIYSVELLPARMAWLIYLNPAAGFVQAHRAAILGTPIDWPGLAISSGLGVLLLVFGLFYFARAERQFADVA
jgi:lipopolysaccharide transport system permease protein